MNNLIQFPDGTVNCLTATEAHILYDFVARRLLQTPREDWTAMREMQQMLRQLRYSVEPARAYDMPAPEPW